MTSDYIRIEARIHFLRTDDGGRTTAIQGEGSYRPNHNFFGPDDRKMSVGFIKLAKGEVVSPGNTISKEISFLAWSDLLPKMHEGWQWRIQEGSKLVAVGTILRVLEN